MVSPVVSLPAYSFCVQIIPGADVCHFSLFLEQSATIGESVQRVNSSVTRLATSLNAYRSVSARFFCSGPAKRTTCCCTPYQPLLPLSSGPIQVFRPSCCLGSFDFRNLKPPYPLSETRHRRNSFNNPKWTRSQPSPPSRTLRGRLPLPRAFRL